jgi:cell division septation protein DedD
MRPNSRVRGRFILSLDGRQVAGAVGLALVVLGGAFLLGLDLGRRLAAPASPPRPASPLAALERVPPARPSEKEPRLSFHDALTKGPPETAAPVEARPRAPPPPLAPAPAPPARAEPAPVPSSLAPAAEKPPARPLPPGPAEAGPRPDPVAAALARARAAAPPGGDGEGEWSIQVGAAQNEFEARRIAARFAAEGARVVAADLPGKGRWYRVKVGRFATRAEAERRLEELSRQAGVKGFVTDAR